MITWSNYANDIFAHQSQSRDNLIVQAVAGAGKTSVIVEAAHRHQPLPGERILFCAFGRVTVKELRDRLPPYVKVATMNSLGWRALAKRMKAMGVPGGPRLDDKKSMNIIKENWAGHPSVRQDAGNIVKLVSLGKANLLAPDSSMLDWVRLMDHYRIVPEVLRTEDIVYAASTVLAESVENWMVTDYDDQIYLPIALDMSVDQYDRVLLDEAQDITRAQIELAHRSCSGKLTAVGDRNQSIYGWRGADVHSMDLIKSRFDCDELPLSICYRCPKSVVAEAKTIVPQIEPWDEAAEGAVEPITVAPLSMIAERDMVICRTNAPLMRLAYQLILTGRPVNFLGKELAVGLKQLTLALKNKKLDWYEAVDRWEERQTDALKRQDREDACELVHDRASCIRMVIERVEALHENPSVEDLLEEIDRLFRPSKDAGATILSTVHQAKGLEAPRVFVLRYDEMPPRWARDGWQRDQEFNIKYVAITRAQESLFLVRSPDDEKKEEANA